MLSPIARITGLAALFLAASVSAQTAKSAPDPAKLPTVNGKPISKSAVDFMVKQRTAQGAQDNPQLRQMVVDNLISQEVVAQESERKGMGKRADVQLQLGLARQQILIQAFVQDYFKAHPLKEEAMLAEYNRVKSSRGEKEYKARHILVDKEDEAKSLIERLKKGEKFEDLAKNSKDPGSKDQGGDLNWNPPSTFVKPFSDALMKLEKGKFTETPVQSQFGWHVIQLDDMRTTQFPAYEDVKSQIRSMLQDQEIQKVVAELRAKAKIQ